MFVVVNDRGGVPSSVRQRPADIAAAVVLAAAGCLLVEPLAAVGGVLLPAAILAALASLVVRYRRAGGLERRQIGWFAYAGGLIVLAFAVANVLGALGVPESVTSYLNVLPLAALPLAIGVALARHRLYDLETLVDRTLLATALAGFVTVVYVVVIVARRQPDRRHHRHGDRRGRDPAAAGLAAAADGAARLPRP